jgi:hypothetical protein
MTPNELTEKQDELDLKKYNQSLLAHCDMSGKTEYCKGCLLRTTLPSCVIDHETRKRFSVCARNFFRLEEEKNAVRETKLNFKHSGGQLVLDSNSGQTKRNKKKSSVL